MSYITSSEPRSLYSLLNTQGYVIRIIVAVTTHWALQCARHEGVDLPYLIESSQNLHEAGLNCHYPQFAEKETEAQMEGKSLPKPTKLLRGGVRLWFTSWLRQETTSPRAPSRVGSKERTPKTNKQNLVGGSNDSLDIRIETGARRGPGWNDLGLLQVQETLSPRTRPELNAVAPKVGRSAEPGNKAGLKARACGVFRPTFHRENLCSRKKPGAFCSRKKNFHLMPGLLLVWIPLIFYYYLLSYWNINEAIFCSSNTARQVARLCCQRLVDYYDDYYYSFNGNNSCRLQMPQLFSWQSYRFWRQPGIPTSQGRGSWKSRLDLSFHSLKIFDYEKFQTRTKGLVCTTWNCHFEGQKWLTVSNFLRLKLIA